MKLSEAILKGCEGTHKITGDLFEGLAGNPTPTGCCALGAAILGIGWEKYDINTGWRAPEEFISEYIEGITPKTPVPGRMSEKCFGGLGSNLLNVVVLLNDYSSMPREDIARLLAECGY